MKQRSNQIVVFKEAVQWVGSWVPPHENVLVIWKTRIRDRNVSRPGEWKGRVLKWQR